MCSFFGCKVLNLPKKIDFIFKNRIFSTKLQFCLKHKNFVKNVNLDKTRIFGEKSKFG